MLKLLNDRSVDRIVGGAYINITFVPYMLSLMLYDQHMCGGGIVNENWAVTAAHCLIQFTDRINDLRVRSGSSYIDQGGTIHAVSNIILHENYNPTTSDFDLAVLKVNPPFKYDNETQPLTIAKDDSTKNDFGLVAGWGYFMSFNPVLSRQLQYIYLPKIDKDECRKKYGKQFPVTNTQVCYGLENGGEDTCKGDSGGPMVNTDEVLIGLTSWGIGCAQPNNPGVYTDAILLRDWIKNKTANDGNNV